MTGVAAFKATCKSSGAIPLAMTVVAVVGALLR
jgi:hypothetical protein